MMLRHFSKPINIKMAWSIKKHEITSKVLDIMADVLKNYKDAKRKWKDYSPSNKSKKILRNPTYFVWAFFNG